MNYNKRIVNYHTQLDEVYPQFGTVSVSTDSRQSILDFCKDHAAAYDPESLSVKKYCNLYNKQVFNKLVPEFANCKVVFYPEGVEIVKYPKPVKINRQFKKDEITEDVLNKFAEDYFRDFGMYPELNMDNDNIDRSRLISIDDDGIVTLNRDMPLMALFDRLKYNHNYSRKYTLNKLYSVALSNSWDYFFTLTFDQREYDSSDIKVVSESYKAFQDKLRYLDSNIKSLFIVEYHKDKKHFHLHGFIMGDLNKYLSEALDPVTKQQIYDSNHNPVFNCSLWDYGFNTCSKLPHGYNKFRVVNYLSKYINKEFGSIPYGYNILFRSRGLKESFSCNVNISERELYNLVYDYYLDSAAIDKIVPDMDITNSSICRVKKNGIISFRLFYNYQDSA